VRTLIKQSDLQRQPTIRAELHGSSSCTAEGLTVKSPSPVIGLCKALVDAGRDPATPLEAYRDNVICACVCLRLALRHSPKRNRR
jgi:hypothetical protein